MNFCGKSACASTSTSSPIYQVPGQDASDMDRIADRTFRRYSWNTKRSGKGTTIVWFRNDLRILDNEALYNAWLASETVLPVYCVDPRLFGTTYYFGFPKTGALRTQFLIDCLADLRKNLMKRGLNLLIQHGKPEDILPSLAKAFGAHTVYAQKETCSEELNVERLVNKGLQQVVIPAYPEESSGATTSNNPRLQFIWGTTLYNIDDLPFGATSVPDVYTQFRKTVEAKCTIRTCIKLPTSLGPPPQVGDWGCLPSLEQLGFCSQNASKGMKFVGGETAALSRVYEYFWMKDLLKVYKETRNGMLGPDYSTKFSPWLASGSLSPRFVHEEVKRYEEERQANSSTYWVLFELIWRDYFRFLSVKCGNSLFHVGGPRKVLYKWSQDKNLFESWRDGRTGYPLIDANMKELSTTGFMSNRGRQIVCSFLVRDMGIDWRMGAEWFETCLLDYDPCSNYGNWTYGSGVGNDPREDRYFSIPKQEINGMADDKGVGEGENKERSPTATANEKKKRQGFISRIWNGIFRLHGDDFEKRLQYISKEEAAVLTRMSRRSQSWRRTIRHLIIFSIIFEVIAVGYAIMTTGSIDMNWKMRAFRVLPMFLLPVLSSAAYSTVVSLTRMCDRRDQKILENLRAERQAKIDELKEKTNYYTTQQLIQRYDPDPAAKAAAATVLASKLGADSGLKVYVGDESNLSASTGQSNDVELVQGSGLRNRKQMQSRYTTPGATTPKHPDQQFVGTGETDETQTSEHNQLVVVEHHQPQSSTTNDGGWIARIAALLVGEDPTQSYALICGNCHMHNGLARREDFPYITYYCPHCNALNKPRQSDEGVSGLNSSNMEFRKTDVAETVKNALASAGDNLITSNSPLSSGPEIEEASERANLGEKAS